MKKICFLSLFLFAYAFASAQNMQETFKKVAVGKRWGLRHFIEKYPLRSNKDAAKIGNAKIITDSEGRKIVVDTLISTHDCQQDYLDLRTDGTFASTNVEQGGTWAFVSDNQITFRKANGAKHTTVSVSYASEDSLILTDSDNPNDIFIQIFKVCGLDDKTFADNRQIYKIWDIWGITGGYQWWEQNGLVEVGITRWRQFEWNRVIYAFSANLEIDPKNGMHGASLNLWSEDNFFAYGIAATTHSNFKDTFIGIKPMVGFSFNRLFSNSGYTAHVIYGYNFNIGNKSSDFVNRHSVTFRINLPFKRQSRDVVREANQDDDNEFKIENK